MIFYLGTHRANWLERVSVPLFIARQTLAPRKTLPRALGTWALDSGAFSELSLHGKWTTPPGQYVAEVRRFHDEIGKLAWSASQDWMCEPFMLAKTGLTVADHQRRTVDSYLDLMARDATLPWAPVLQGWALQDYFDHADAYERAGVNLAQLPVVGLGSVCRRQGTAEATQIVTALADRGLSLHGFGMKTTGLRQYASGLHSSDSMAWSFRARKRGAPLPGCHGHKNCANCITFAMHWRTEVLASVETGDRRSLWQQQRMFA